MAMCAYDEEYLPLAQRVLGDMLDYAVNTLNYELGRFYRLFIISGVAAQFEIGNPAYAAGKNGCEVAKEVIGCSGISVPDTEDVMYLDKSPEYWTGWALGYYQWKRCETFKSIERVVSVDMVCSMYYPMHEADIERFVIVMDEKMSAAQSSQLRRLRAYAGLSQRMLAEASGVPIRQIQLFEQGERSINRTQAETLVQLANALKCSPAELLEKPIISLCNNSSDTAQAKTNPRDF